MTHRPSRLTVGIMIAVLAGTASLAAAPMEPASAILGIPCPIARTPRLYGDHLVEGRFIACPKRDRVVVQGRSDARLHVIKVCGRHPRRGHLARCRTLARCHHTFVYRTKLTWWTGGMPDADVSHWRRLC